MDHLPQPALRNQRSQDWRCAGTRLLDSLHDGYEPVTFQEYPRQRGFSMEDLMSGKFPPEQSQRAAAVAQNWLFFGLVEGVFGVHVPSEDLLLTDEVGDRFLCTRSLTRYWGEWRERMKGLGDMEKHSTKVRLQEVFRDCTRFFQLYFTASSGHYPDSFAIYLNPLAVLVETLQFWKDIAFGFADRGEPLPTNFSAETSAELVNRGWCPYTVANFILPSGSPSCFAYTRRFRDRPPFILGTHSDCTATVCSIASVDTSTYKTQHRSLFCENEDECVVLFPSMDSVEGALKTNKIPIMSLTKDLQLEAVEDSQRPYVAISHVWADGMGSTSEQGFPSCQAKFLSESATAAYNYLHEAELDSIPFWVDSVCVPARPDLRHKAIIMMAESYSRAAAVVVIDSMLLTVSVEDSIEEQLFVLFISNWVQRMWTLPEVLLSKQLLFRVSDGLIDFRTYFTDEVLALQFQNPVASKLLGWFAQLMVTPFTRSVGHAQPTSLDDVALHLAKRTSSRPEDEILAIAGIFNLDVREYLPLDGDNRMANFLLRYNAGKVPYDILFMDGPKLPVENFTWAPQSFMKRQLGVELTGSSEDAWSIATLEGLVGSHYYCLQLQEKWDNDEPPRIYRLGTESDDILTILFDRNVDPDQNSVQVYDFLVLQQPVEKGEEFLAAGCRLLGTVEGAESRIAALRLSLECYIHVFNEDGNDGWNKLHIANNVRVREEPVVIV